MQVSKAFPACSMGVLLVVFLASTLSCSKSEPPVTESLPWVAPAATQIPPGDELLYRAVTSNDVTEARRLLESGADPNMVPWGKDPALIEAVRSDNSEMVQLLLEAGADIHAHDIWKNSALMAALEFGNLDIIEALLEASAEPDEATMNYHFNPRWLSDHQSRDLLRVLLEGGMSPDIGIFGGDPLLLEAVNAQEPVLVQMLLDAGADPNVADGFGRSALVRAVSYEHVFRLDLPAVEQISYPNILERQEDFRLFAYAATPRARNRIPEAISNGGSANSALIIALAIRDGPHADLRSEFDVDEAVPVLLELGADPGGLLITAARRGDGLIFNGLLELGANPYRLFQVETVGGDTDIVQALLDAGAEPGDALARAVAPVDEGFADGPASGRIGAPDANLRMVERLLQAGADPGASGPDGRLPLVEAIFHYQFEIAELLIDSGVDLPAKVTGSGLELLLSSGIVSVGDGSLKAGDQWGQFVADSAFASADLASGLGRGFADSFSGLTAVGTGMGTGVGVGVGGGVGGIIGVFD